MNPYGEMAKGMGAKAASPVVLGEVTQFGGGKLRVTADGLPLTEKDILINADLVQDMQVSGTLDGMVNCSYGSISRMTVNKGTLTRPPLAAGDRVLLLTADRQTYYLVCKVVAV